MVDLEIWLWAWLDDGFVLLGDGKGNGRCQKGSRFLKGTAYLQVLGVDDSKKQIKIRRITAFCCPTRMDFSKFLTMS
jgi:hypothetical protein